jgi:Tfp pilus assembly protein PilV
MRYPDSRGVGSATGFSMLEVMIAGAILLIISLGLIPLFARAIRDNETGSDYTQISNGNKSRLEEASQLPINHASLGVPAGMAEGQAVESWAQGDARLGDAAEGWWPGAPAGKGRLLWTRTSRIHLYSMDALDKRARDFVLDPLERQLGTGDPCEMGRNHLKEVEVVLESEKESTLFGGNKRVTFRLLKAF